MGEEVDHPWVEGLEPDKPLPEIMEKSDENLDGRLVSVLFEPTRVTDLAMSLKRRKISKKNLNMNDNEGINWIVKLAV